MENVEDERATLARITRLEVREQPASSQRESSLPGGGTAEAGWSTLPASTTSSVPTGMPPGCSRKRSPLDRFSRGFDRRVPETDPRERQWPRNDARRACRPRNAPVPASPLVPLAASHLRPPGPRGRQGSARGAQTHCQQHGRSHLPGAGRLAGAAPLAASGWGRVPPRSPLAASAKAGTVFV